MTSNTQDGPSAPRRFLPATATVIFVAVVCGIALSHQQPPQALPAEAPPDVFSSARAMKHVEAIAQKPHPLGSAAEEPVRAYIMAELKALGFEPEIQQPGDSRPIRSESESKPSRRDVRNIVARWRGSGSPGKKALFLSAHYDSSDRGPGAGDDASGVAAILESLRAMKAGPPPERDVIILINDGEERGLFGADVFAKEHPWAKDVGVVLNFDARGNSGPSYMFETSDGNGWLIEQLARALPHPMATSLTMEVYRLMPNDTDLTIYKKQGMAGLNFAFVGGLYAYHTSQDTPANLDRRTLQHQGENLLAMARHLVRLDLDDVRRHDVVYCSVLQRFVVIYPMSWVRPLMGIAVLAYLAVAGLGLARGRVRLVEIVVGFGVFLVSLVATIFAVDLALVRRAGHDTQPGRVHLRARIPAPPDLLDRGGAGGGGRLRPRGPGMVVGGPWPGNPGLVAGGDGGDLALAARRELRLPLALAGDPGRPGCGVPGAVGSDGRPAGNLAGGRPVLDRPHDDLARLVRRLESAADRPADVPGCTGRRRAGAHGRTGRGPPAERGVRDRSLDQPGHTWKVGARPMPW